MPIVIDHKGHSHTLAAGESILSQWGEGRLKTSSVALGKEDGSLYDLTRPLEERTCYTLVARASAEGLSLLRHDAAHLMAQAVKLLFPGTQVTIGPSIEDGFYYDFAREAPFTPEDFPRIEAKMHELVDQGIPITREVWSRTTALQFFGEQGEEFKRELIASIPEDEVLSVYHQGTFTDLCRGPHLPNTAWLGHGFKLMKVAGAYWRGDHRNPMLTRIYGTAWQDEKALKAYLHRLEEAEKRDHRRLGAAMGLFHFSDVAVGSVFWQAPGLTLYRTLQDYIRGKLKASGYSEVATPQLCSLHLWETSGHLEQFGQNMLTCTTPEESGGRMASGFALKPMNCPCHVHLFATTTRSYKELPLRMAEFGCCTRYEPSGALKGLMRLRVFTQDDAHIFCTPQQVLEETVAFCRLLQEVYAELGFSHIDVKLATKPEKALGDPEIWAQAEEALAQGARAAGLSYTMNPGEGAFYGPKLEFVLHDALGRAWQCGTLQADFVLPSRLGAHYTGPDGARHTPVMLHRAILGSFERFIGILLEHYGGNLPLWLAPIQVAIAPIYGEDASANAATEAYARRVLQALEGKNARCIMEGSTQTISYKVRALSMQKVPLIMVIGAKEAANDTVTVRRLGSFKTKTFPLEASLMMLEEEIASKALPLSQE